MTTNSYYSREASTLYFIQYLQGTATIYTYFEHYTEVGCYGVQHGDQLPGVSVGGGEGGLGGVVREGLRQTPPQGPQPRPTAEQDTHNMTSSQPGNDVTQPTNDAEERLYTMEEPGNGAMQSLCFTPLTSLAKIGDWNYLKGKVKPVSSLLN